MAYSLTAELFSELAIGILIFSLRFFARWKVVGFRNFWYDDLFAGIAVVFWVLEATFLYTCGYFGNNIGLNAETAMEVPDSEVPRLVKGSKHAYVAWILYILLIWSLKAVLLLLYTKLAMGIWWQKRLAKFVIVVSVATFLTSLFWHIFSCFPTSRAWQIKPYPGENCTFRRGNYIIITILDVVTDMGIIAIPLPLLLATTLSLRRKLTLGLLFSSGIFVMVCSILRAYYSLKDIETLAVALGWASREILVASAVVCAPSIKPLISSAKKKLSSNHRSESGKNHDTSSRGRPKLTDTDYDVERRVTTITTITSGNQKRPGHYKLFSIGRQTSDGDIERTLHKSESQDHINVVVTELDGSSMYSGTGTEQGIYVTTEYSVAKE